VITGVDWPVVIDNNEVSKRTKASGLLCSDFTVNLTGVELPYFYLCGGKMIKIE
jgi:hypothetical protein